MADYSKEKVPDLKKLLQERGLVISGNKADLIARLQEDDAKKSGGGAAAAAGAGEDEIDWDEDDKPTTEPAAAAVAAGGQGAVSNPTAVPNQVVDTEPSTTSDLTVKEPESKPAEPPTDTTAEAAPEEPKPDFSIGLKQSDALTEAEKRAARAKRFGIPENEEAKKLAERAKKFGLDAKVKDTVVSTLDSALPERRAKRGREGRDKEGGEGRAAKRQTPDRRLEGRKGKGRGEGKKEGGGGGGGEKKEPASKIADDPAERAKMEARAKKFGKPLPT